MINGSERIAPPKTTHSAQVGACSIVWQLMCLASELSSKCSRECDDIIVCRGARSAERRTEMVVHSVQCPLDSPRISLMDVQNCHDRGVAKDRCRQDVRSVPSVAAVPTRST